MTYQIRHFCNIYSSIAQSVEHAAVNRAVVGSSPTRGVFLIISIRVFGSMVKRLRHRPFTAVTRVRFPLESLVPMWLNWQSS